MILSASRRTDIPAFYSEWFFNRIKEGYVYVRNPFNSNAVSKIAISPRIIDCIVFWTKNPSQKFIANLDLLSEFMYYFQFTISSYGTDIEKNVPKKQAVIENFKRLSEKTGQERVIWRYDPIAMSNRYTVDYHVNNFGELAHRLNRYTKTCKISFIEFYKKCERNLENTTVREPDTFEKLKLAKMFRKIALEYNIIIEACAMENTLDPLRVKHGKCIDNELIEKITKGKIKAKKDKNQRERCECIESIDIGAYNTCLYHCLYCYANFSRDRVLKQFQKHVPTSPLLVGEVEEGDTIKERQVYSLLEYRLFD